MAAINLSRQGDNRAHRALTASRFTVNMPASGVVSGDAITVGTLPANILIESVAFVVTTASDATTATAGFTLAGGGSLGTTATFADLTVAAVYKAALNTAALHLTTPSTFVVTPTITGTQTVGSFDLVITYVELGRRTGTYTNEVK